MEDSHSSVNLRLRQVNESLLHLFSSRRFTSFTYARYILQKTYNVNTTTGGWRCFLIYFQYCNTVLHLVKQFNHKNAVSVHNVNCIVHILCIYCSFNVCIVDVVLNFEMLSTTMFYIIFVYDTAASIAAIYFHTK